MLSERPGFVGLYENVWYVYGQSIFVGTSMFVEIIRCPHSIVVTFKSSSLGAINCLQVRFGFTID